MRRAAFCDDVLQILRSAITDCGPQLDAIPSRKRALNAINKKLGIIGLGENRTFLAKVRCFLGLVRHRPRQNHLGARPLFF